MATTQKVSAVLKKTGTPRGYYAASGRVKGWGSWHEGAEVKAEVNEHYVCKFCYANSLRNEGHRFNEDGTRYNTRCSSYSWSRRTTKTGRVLITWHRGERHQQHDSEIEFAKATAALEEAGLTVERDDDRLVVA